jgi:hypothetical protein
LCLAGILVLSVCSYDFFGGFGSTLVIPGVEALGFTGVLVARAFVPHDRK